MSNLEKWRLFTRDLQSPDSYINMGFYYLISSCLQRRIWYGPNEHRVFPNVYFIFVGEAGVGKGLVIGQVNYFLRYFQRRDSKLADALVHNLITTGIRPTVATNKTPDGTRILDTDPEGGTIVAGKHKQSKEPLMFPVAAEKTTVEALIQALAESRCMIELPGETDLAPNGKYLYKSLAFCLEELSSLFGNKNLAEAIADFFLCAFDCKDYEYDTKHQGKDLLRKPCLNFLAGTTPTYMQRAFDSAVLNDGFCARSIFIYEFSNRHNKYKIEDLDEEQKKARQDLLWHVYRLSKVVGRVTFSPEAEAYLKYYFEELLPRGEVRANRNIKLNSYYARKKVHTWKMSMILHFADNYDMVISLATVKRALDVLADLEGRMHYALTFGSNPLAKIQKNIIQTLRDAAKMRTEETEKEFIRTGSTFSELWIQFSDDVREAELRECLTYCIGTGIVKSLPHPLSREDVYYFTLNKKK